MKIQKPDVASRGNCPDGGLQFAAVVWRYVRSLALGAKAQALKLSGQEEEFQQTMSYLETYLSLLRVSLPVICLGFVPELAPLYYYFQFSESKGFNEKSEVNCCVKLDFERSLKVQQHLFLLIKCAGGRETGEAGTTNRASSSLYVRIQRPCSNLPAHSRGQSRLSAG